MKLKNFPLLFLTFLAISYTHEQFDQYIDRWNLIANIEGSFDKNHTIFQKSKCDPCTYEIVVYRDYVQLLIDNPFQGNNNSVLAFEFNLFGDIDQTLWEFDSKKIKLENNQDITQVLQRTTNKGVEWDYELTLPIEGLIVKDHKFSSNQNLTPIFTLLFSFLIFLTFSLTSKSRQEQSIQIPSRTSLISLLILSHLQHLILIEIITISTKYTIHEQSYLIKFLWYVIYTIPFGLIILQVLYIYDAIRRRFYQVFAKVQNVKFRDSLMVGIFLGGVYAVTLGLLCLYKGFWIYAYFALYLIWQIGQSIFSKTYPYIKLTVYFFILIGYQMFLSIYEPLFWFEQLTRKEILIYWTVIIVIFIVGSILQKQLIGIQNVNRVIFEQSKAFQMGHSSSFKSSDINLEA